MILSLRAVDLNSFDDFVHQLSHPEGDRLPMSRVERIALDEPQQLHSSFSDIFERRVGRLLEGYRELFA
jgi:hypothetical protein